MKKRWGARKVLGVVGLLVGFAACFVGGSLLAESIVVVARWAGVGWSLDTTIGALSFRVVMYGCMAILAVLALKYIARRTVSAQLLGVNRSLSFSDLGFTLAGGVVYIALAVASLLLLKLVPGVDATQVQSLGIAEKLTGSTLVFAYVVLVIITPLCEELLFRGLLYGQLRQSRIGPWVSAIVVSALFGVMHGQWNVAVDVFWLSMVACYLRELTGTIWPGVVLHILKNGVAFWVVFVLGITSAG